MAKLNFSDFTLRVRRGLTAAIALATTYSQAGELGYTTDEKTLYVSDGTSFRQVATTLTVVSKTGTYTALITDSVILCNTSGGAFTVTVPAASTCKGRVYIVKDSGGAAGANNITIATSGGNIDGTATKLIAANYGSLRVVSDGTNWFTI